MLWIRSQNRCRLVCCKIIEIEEFDEKQIIGDRYVIGTYSSKEKALKVLDDIQQQICSNKVFEVKAQLVKRTERAHVEAKYYVYQMPQDDEVVA